MSPCLSDTVSTKYSGNCARMFLHVQVAPHNEQKTDSNLGYFTEEDIALIAMPAISQNVTVSHIGSLHVPCKETVGTE